MLQGPILLGFGLLLFGLLFVLLVWSLLRIVPKFRPAVAEPFAPSFVQISQHQEGILIVEEGGRIRYINGFAQEWFDLIEGETPNIERLGRRVRPGEVFFEMCASEGQARFSINGKLVDAVSYRVPGTVPAVLVALRQAENGLSPQNADRAAGASGSAIQTVTEFGQAIASSLSLEDTVQSALQNLERLVASDFLELKLWGDAAKSPAVYRLVDAGTERRLSREKVSEFGEYAAFLMAQRKELFIADTRSFVGVRYDSVGSRVPPMGSYIGLPLTAYGVLVGTLEVGVIPVNSFTADDLNILQLVAGQAAVALRNASLYETQRRWNQQLLGLTNLSQSVGALHDLKDLFSRLVDGLFPLFDVDVFGFLLYDEQRRSLEAQLPFAGLPDNVVQLYRTVIRPGGAGEKYALKPELISSLDARVDEVWNDLELRKIAQAASIRDTTLVPLVSGGRFLGYLQLSNHRAGQERASQDELRLLNLVANQVASIIDNALLVHQARQRNQRAEALRRIASMVSSQATLDEILPYAMQELSQLLQAEVGALFLADDADGSMRARLPSVFGVSEDVKGAFARIYIKPSQYHLTVSATQRTFVSGDLQRSEMLPVFQPMVKRLGLQSAVVAPLSVRGSGIGELMLGSTKTEYFSNADIQFSLTIASQLAIAVENARRAGETDAFLRRRAENLPVLVRLVRSLNAVSNLRDLARVAYEESLAASGAKCGMVVFYEDERANQSLAYCGHSQMGEPQKPSFSGSLDGRDLFTLSFEPGSAEAPHPDVLSVLVAPIAYQGKALGFLELHAETAAVFDEVTQEVTRNLTAMAGVFARKILNSQQQQEESALFRRRAESFSQFFSTVQSLRADDSIHQALENLARGIQRATPFEVVLASLNDPETGILTRVAGVGLSPSAFAQLQAQRQSWTSVAQLLKPEFEVGSLYFLPADKSPILPADLSSITVLDAPADAPNAWNPEDMLLLPIYDGSNTPLGLISLDAPRDGLRPDNITFQTLEVFANQLALTISGAQNIIQFNQQIDLLNKEIERQKSLVSYSQRSLPILLQKDLEHTVSVTNLNQRARHIRAGLQLTEAISRQFDAPSALLTLGQQVLTSFDMSISIVARETPDGPRIANIIGSLPRNVNPEAMFGQRNPLRTCLQTGETILSVNLDEDQVWHDTPFLTALRAKSFICIPVVINEKPIAAVLAADSETMPVMFDEDRQVYLQISKQVSIILQNISLLNETRQRLHEVNLLLDFSRRLGGLNPREILSALLQSALRVIPSAHAGVVLQWEASSDALTPVSAANYVDDDSILEILYHAEEGLPGRVFSSRAPRRVDEINFAADYNLSAENLLKYRKATGGRFPVSSLLAPVQMGAQNMGMLILDNFNTPAAFRADDEAILLSLTQQVALSLENVHLVQATQQRAAQLQALNAVASTLTASLKRDELVASLLERFARVIPYDTAILWLRNANRMVVADARGYNDDEERKGLTVDVQDSLLLSEMLHEGKAISVGDVRMDTRFASLVDSKYLSWLGIPLIAKGQVIGVIATEKAEAYYYGEELVQISTTFASQAAVAIDNANLFEESLQRAAELDERSQRLALLNQFSSEMAGSLNASQVLRLTASHLMDALRADRALVMVVDKRNRASLVTSLPEETSRPAPARRSTAESPIIAQMRESLSVYTVEDVRADTRMRGIAEFLEDCTSLLLVPVMGSQALYVVAIQSSDFRRFLSTEMELARTVGNQASVALENADLYQSTLATASRLEILNQVSFEIGASLDLEDIYRSVHSAAAKLMPVDAFIIALLDEKNNEVNGAYLVDMGQRITGTRLPNGQGITGQVIVTGQPLLTLQSSDVEARGGVAIGEKGTPHSIIAVPMLSGGKVIGALSAQSYQYNAYGENDQQILSTLSNQVTVAIQNARSFEESQKLAATLEQRVVERTAELEREQRNTETLLRILTEVSASLDLDRALSRTLALLNEAIDAEQGTIMLLHAEDGTLHYRAGYGYLTDDAKESGAQQPNFRLKVGEGLAGWVVKHRQPVLVDDLYLDPRWVVSKGSQNHRSALVAPLIVGEDLIGAIMVFHRRVAHFTDDSLEMVRAIGSQVAISINNAQLYELIRDQAERLGSMLRQQQVQASRQTAILQAVADGVLVTDSGNQITFLNPSAERILGLEAEKLQNQPLENFSGLFGNNTAWAQTVKEWSQESAEARAGETYAEQISLETGQVVLVHLAPVTWRNEFLGTVSIFRDITHEVEVDRLKSEFVATVSHELRTPMTSIRGYVDILLMGAAGALNENQAHFLEIVKNNTERLNILVNDLLDVSRIEAGRVALSVQAVDVQELAAEVVQDTQRRAEEENKDIHISLNITPPLPRALADPERLRQIIDNLVDNAYNYTPAGGSIQISLHPVNGSVQVSVKDSGIGIAPEQQDRVFDRFFRGENPMVLATPGTGLGLPIVRQLVEMHHGKIWLNSAGIPGEGSTFSFTLPAYTFEE